MTQEPSPELSCQEIFAALSEYVDGELTIEMMELIGDHISDCAPCVAFVESLRRSVALCGDFAPNLKPAPLPDDVVSDLKAAYQRALASGGEPKPRPDHP